MSYLSHSALHPIQPYIPAGLWGVLLGIHGIYLQLALQRPGLQSTYYWCTGMVLNGLVTPHMTFDLSPVTFDLGLTCLSYSWLPFLTDYSWEMGSNLDGPPGPLPKTNPFRETCKYSVVDLIRNRSCCHVNSCINTAPNFHRHTAFRVDN